MLSCIQVDASNEMGAAKEARQRLRARACWRTRPRVLGGAGLSQSELRQFEEESGKDAEVHSAWGLGRAIECRYDSTVDHDDFTQAGNLDRMFDDAHRDRLAGRIAGMLSQARRDVQVSQLCHFFRTDEDYGKRVADKLGVDVGQFLEIAGAADH